MARPPDLHPGPRPLPFQGWTAAGPTGNAPGSGAAPGHQLERHQSYVQGYLQAAGFTDPVTVTGAGGSSGTTLSVRVDYTYNFLVLPKFVVGLTGDLNLTAESVMRLE